MPTIASLPAAGPLSPTDTIPIDQGTGTNAVTLASLLAGQQPAILTPTGSLLGRISLGAGGPETVGIGAGLVLSSGTISVDALDTLLGGQTVNQLLPGAPPKDTDALAVDQGGAALVRQTMAAVWSYIEGKLPIATARVVELTTNTVLDATAHNGAILVCSQPLTLTANFANMGPGFVCDVVNLSAGAVTMGSGITVGSGANALPAQMAARLVAITYSGGNIVFWADSPTVASPTSGGSAVSSGGSTVTSGGSTVTSGGSSTPSGVTVTFQTAPSGSYAAGQANIGVSGTLHPGNAAPGLQFGFSTSASVAPSSWTAATLVNTESNGDTFWGAYVTMPTTAGTYYCWAQAVGGAASAITASIVVA
ncbi:MAG: hypothetical protein HIU92_10930 [Proteobacteria bacterium]|nr:hypothetical protein [Pseudomonadota bacterium]